MKPSMKICGRHSSLCLPKACFSEQPSPGVKVSPLAEQLPGTAVHASFKQSRLNLSRQPPTCQGKMQSRPGTPPVDMMPTSRCRGTPGPTPVPCPHHRETPAFFPSRPCAGCKRPARSSLPCSALLCPALLAEIPGGGRGP